MGQQQYELLMGEMDKIAAKVELFPESVQEKVFNLLTGELTRPMQLTATAGVPARVEPTVPDHFAGIDQIPDTQSEFISMIKEHASGKRLGAITHPQFVTYACHVYSNLAPKEIKANEIGKAEVEYVYQIAGRKPPRQASREFGRAKSDLNWLENGSTKGKSKLTAQGRYFVEHDLLGSSEER